MIKYIFSQSTICFSITEHYTVKMSFLKSHEDKFFVKHEKDTALDLSHPFGSCFRVFLRMNVTVLKQDLLRQIAANYWSKLYMYWQQLKIISPNWLKFFTKGYTQRPIRLCSQHNDGVWYTLVTLYFLEQCFLLQTLSVWQWMWEVGCWRLQHSNGRTSTPKYNGQTEVCAYRERTWNWNIQDLLQK